MKLSGWCSPAFGTCESQKAHRICGQRRRDAGVVCECGNFEGHESLESPVQQGDSGVQTGKIGAEDKAAPGGASTPDSQGLADREGIDL